MARARALSRNVLKVLDEYGIGYKVAVGELFIDGRDWRRYNRLCDEGKLPREVCWQRPSYTFSLSPALSI